MKTSLALVLCSILASPLAADGVAIAPPTMGELRGTYNPRIASNGNGFLAIWQTNYSQVGAAFDSLGRRITPLFGLEDRCFSVVSFGDGYLVNCASRSGETTIRHLDAAGHELGVIRSAVEPKPRVAYAATDDRILVSVGASEREFHVIDAAGNTFGKPISFNPSDYVYVRAVEPTATGFFLVTEQPASAERMRVIHVSEAGIITSAFAVPFPWPALLPRPVTAVVGGTLLIAVTDLAGGTIFTASVDATRLIASNTFSTSRLIPLDLVPAGDGAMLIGGRAEGTTTLAWKLTAEGSPVGHALNPPSEPRILATASNGRLIYAIGRPSFPDQMAGLPLNAETLAETGPAESLAVGPMAQYSTRIASSSSATMAVWAEPGRVRARQLRGGQPLGVAVDVEISQNPVGSQVAGNDDDVFLVAWHENGEIRARRVSIDGRLLDSHELTIAPLSGGYPSGRLALATDGRDFIAMWVHDRKLLIATISADGIVGAPRVIGEQTADQPAPRWEDRTGLTMTWTGDRYLLAWSHEFWSASAGNGYGGIESTELRMLALDRSGKPIEGTARLVARDLRHPAIAHGDGFTLISATASENFRALLLDSNGNIVMRHDLQPQLPPAAPSSLTASDVTWDGIQFAIVFRNETVIHLSRIPIYGIPRSSIMADVKVLDGSSVGPSIAGETGEIHMVMDEWRSVDRLPTTSRAMVYRAEDFVPLNGRRRSVGR